jgi:hypothetical protein
MNTLRTTATPGLASDLPRVVRGYSGAGLGDRAFTLALCGLPVGGILLSVSASRDAAPERRLKYDLFAARSSFRS